MRLSEVSAVILEGYAWCEEVSAVFFEESVRASGECEWGVQKGERVLTESSLQGGIASALG